MERRETGHHRTTAGLARGVCLALALVLAVLLPGCRLAHPAQEATLAAPPALTTETYAFGHGLAGLAWAWDTPDGEVPKTLPADCAAEFGRRFARFCADTGIAQVGEIQAEVQSTRLVGSRAGDGRRGGPQAPAGSGLRPGQRPRV